ncbi:MAG TPA: hypothetical protein G4O12_04190 [Dehalococcoidia bacterium]|nr:hypothetical protein [Dehalococcoidia bacterium]
MPKRSSKEEAPKDINILAARIVEGATKEDISLTGKQEKQVNEKNIHAVALGQLGGKRGGPARAKKLTPEQRKEIAKRAAHARWMSIKG